MAVRHFWFDPPLQVHIAIADPSAVRAFITSRHRRDCTPVMVWSLPRVHFWLVPPLQA